MQQFMNDHPTLLMVMLFSSSIGVLSLADIDIILAIILKSVSIISFVIGGAYAVWKWNTEYKKDKHVKRKS